ncbi:hypothetical protein BDB01DRAFT_832337 [Pilobolus umbonatus]|nr:hypothetical protein BDB01DRAFT_832337 [Pilobolus umbonatus]
MCLSILGSSDVDPPLFESYLYSSLQCPKYIFSIETPKLEFIRYEACGHDVTSASCKKHLTAFRHQKNVELENQRRFVLEIGEKIHGYHKKDITHPMITKGNNNVWLLIKSFYIKFEVNKPKYTYAEGFYMMTNDTCPAVYNDMVEVSVDEIEKVTEKGLMTVCLIPRRLDERHANLLFDNKPLKIIRLTIWTVLYPASSNKVEACPIVYSRMIILEEGVLIYSAELRRWYPGGDISISLAIIDRVRLHHISWSSRHLILCFQVVLMMKGVHDICHWYSVVATDN